jgi:hypothetical protein
MGIGAADLRILIQMRAARYLRDKASVCEIGAQQLTDSFLSSRVDLETIRRQFSIREPCPLPQPVASNPDDEGHLLSPVAPFARAFWTWLGFDYAAIDIDGSPGSIPLDLNCDNVSANCNGRYDLVTNFGTTEHVANQLNAFKVIHDLTAAGGMMLHVLPAQGYFNHGLVNYNPKFFWMLARSNGYIRLHSDFDFSRSAGGLPHDIIEDTSMFISEFAERANSYRAADACLRIVFLKHQDRAYVAPLDVDTGSQTEHAILKQRYWPVFEPDAFDRIEEATAPSLRTRVKRMLRPLALRIIRSTRFE